MLSAFPNDYTPSTNRDPGDEHYDPLRGLRPVNLDLSGSHMRNVAVASAKLDAIDTNERGGMQSKLDVRYDLLDGRAMDRLAAVLAYGAKKYAPDNWRLIDVDAHLNHALKHLMNYLDLRAGRVADEGEDDLGHAFCRLFMVVAVDAQGGPSTDTTLGGMAHRG